MAATLPDGLKGMNMNAIPVRKLGARGPEVSALGFGCMGLNFAYGAVLGKADAIRMIGEHVIPRLPA